jgi:hypothetical protein
MSVVFFSFKEERKRLSGVLYLRGFKHSFAALPIAVRIFGGFSSPILFSTVNDERRREVTAAMQYGRGGAGDAYGRGWLLQFGRYAGIFTFKSDV